MYLDFRLILCKCLQDRRKQICGHRRYTRNYHTPPAKLLLIIYPLNGLLEAR
ncbi:hypothetical protein D3C81_1972960 [compost metagenome]